MLAFSSFQFLSDIIITTTFIDEISSNVTEILVSDYLITFIIYFLCLFLGQVFSYSLQRYYFLDPFLSTNRQCLNIQFIQNAHLHTSHQRLKDNFIQENSIRAVQYYEQEKFNTTELHQLLLLLNQYHFMICQRSLYLYARYSAYNNLLHSNFSIYRFFLPKYSRTFAIDQPPFFGSLCTYT